ncbi:MAG: TlpA disulfide reductase family protein [Candidatus Pseudobacter hemicellulosilyticus]|uniref:TlpA disulfide reductase family protein n=1 Tax=Candidatus Pseudobacter hemicellulosilyticus TaxID=3121375 RepID=A0AAJ6BFF5_9BACT|nr:MAG: TlpA disulfide reductase family protein [Pseudobacter sp.]
MKQLPLIALVTALNYTGQCLAGQVAAAPIADSATVKVKLQHAEGHRIYFYRTDGQQMIRDSVYTEANGYRVYRLPAAEDRLQLMMVQDPYFKVDLSKGDVPPPQLQFYLKKGATITIEGNALAPAAAMVSSDDPDVQLYETYRKEQDLLQIKAWMNTRTSGLLESVKDTAAVKALRKDWEKVFQDIDKYKRDFVFSHPGTRPALELFQQFYKRLDTVEARQFFEQFPAEWKQSGTGKEIAAYFQSLNSTVAGQKLPLFRSMGIDGKMVDIARLKDKVLIVDFWGSWCGPCRRSHPHLKALYDQYKKKGLEIIGIAAEGPYEQSQPVWRKAVKEDGINWLQVLNDPDKNDLVKAFAVTAFPTKFIVDRQGNIVLKLIGDEHEELDKTLAQLLP